ncbi:MAG: hypothetical protein ACK4UT_00950 [Moraxellaceae bacterium]
MSQESTCSMILLRLTKRTDLPADVIATLYHAAEAAICEQHEAYNLGLRQGEIAAQHGQPPYMVG